MSTWFLPSYFMLWVLFIAQSIIVLLLLRQVGILNLRVMKQPEPVPGPQLGEPAPAVVIPDLEHSSQQLAIPPTNGRAVLLLFLSPDCPVCQTITPEIVRLAGATRDRLLWGVLAVGDPAACEAFRASHELHGIHMSVVSRSVWDMYGIRGVPYGVLVDRSGIVRARSPVGRQELLERIVADVRGQTDSVSSGGVQ